MFLKEFIMFNKCKTCHCKGDDHKKIVKLMEEHSKQHTIEHWIVVGLLAAILALQVYNYVV